MGSHAIDLNGETRVIGRPDLVHAIEPDESYWQIAK